VLAGPTSLGNPGAARACAVLNEHQSIVWGVLGFVYLLLVLWGGTHALRVWWGILLLGGLLALGVVALRRQTLREFPTAAATPPTGGSSPPTDEITRLTELHKSGAISDDEFERAKTALT
jgi:hypothetical protein